MNASPEEVWIATVEVEPMEGNDFLGEAIGAIVSVMAIASAPREFRARLHQHMEAERFDIVDISNAEPLELRLEYIDLSRELQLVAQTVKLTKATGTGPYNAFLTDEEE